MHLSERRCELANEVLRVASSGGSHAVRYVGLGLPAWKEEVLTHVQQPGRAIARFPVYLEMAAVKQISNVHSIRWGNPPAKCLDLELEGWSTVPFAIHRKTCYRPQPMLLGS
jgi:hypothetical protein